MRKKQKARCLRLVLGDQLSNEISSLRQLSEGDLVLMVEVGEETRYVKHHKQKIVFFLSAMRHFAAELRAKGIQVRYVLLDDPDNTGSFFGEVERAVLEVNPERVVVTEAGEWRVQQSMVSWSDRLCCPVDILEDDRFLCSREEFSDWAGEKKQLRMEFFYRVMRRKTGWLMEGEQPLGGKWNYDAKNRKALPKKLQIPPVRTVEPDEVTQEVIKLVNKCCRDHFGDLETFNWAVTREGALAALEHFIDHRLPWFGDYQDAMKEGEDFLFHAVISPYLNIGLLNPKEVCLAALVAFRNGLVPLNAVEGFIRQILGWREFVRGIYWRYMPAYSKSNYLNAKNNLPEFFWTAETEMNCMRQVIEGTKRTAYSHHIHRLMVTGNFALLTGIAPEQVEAWYLIVYADALDWVELPNVHGMVLHADGGILGSKPYAASGAYINRMSDYCERCRYNPKEKQGADACPFNFMYWDFLIRNRDLLGSNQRMGMAYRNVDRLTNEQQLEIQEQANRFLDQNGILKV